MKNLKTACIVIAALIALLSFWAGYSLSSYNSRNNEYDINLSADQTWAYIDQYDIVIVRDNDGSQHMILR